MNSGWNLMRLGDGIDLVTGFPFGSENYSSDLDDIKLLRGDNIEPGRFRWENVQRWDRSEIDLFSKYQLLCGDVILAMDRPWINSGLKYAVISESDIPCLLVQRVARLRGTGNLNSSYLAQLISSDDFTQYLKSSQTGTAVPHISSEQIKDYKFLLPPLPEQRKIAAILSTWDEATALTKRLIAALRQRKQALIQLLLTGEVRFKEFEGEEWQEVEFSKLAYRVSNQIDPLEYNGDLPCVELEHISQNSGRILGFTSIKQQKSLKNGFTTGQVLFGKLRPYLRKYAQPNFDGVTSSEVWVLSSNLQFTSNNYLFYLVQSDIFSGAVNITSGTKMPRADWETIANTIFNIPSLREQELIVDILRLADEELNTLEQVSNSLQIEKRGLMQQLLTGVIPVQVDE